MSITELIIILGLITLLEVINYIIQNKLEKELERTKKELNVSLSLNKKLYNHIKSLGEEESQEGDYEE